MSMSLRCVATAIATEDLPDAVEPMTATRLGRVLRALPPEFDDGESAQQSTQRIHREDGAGHRA